MRQKRRSLEARLAQGPSQLSEAAAPNKTNRADGQTQVRSNFCVGPRGTLVKQHVHEFPATGRETGYGISQRLFLVDLMQPVLRHHESDVRDCFQFFGSAHWQFVLAPAAQAGMRAYLD